MTFDQNYRIQFPKTVIIKRQTQMIPSIENITLKRKSKSISSFLLKTFDLLNEQAHQNVVRWASNGIGFIVLNQEDFSKQVLPKYFKHSNYSSFVRQLNMYNFHKLRESNTESYFHHESFDRNHQNALAEIKRKPEKKKRKNIDDQQDQECQKTQETVRKTQQKQNIKQKNQKNKKNNQKTDQDIFFQSNSEFITRKKQKNQDEPLIQTTRQMFSSSFTLQFQNGIEQTCQNDKSLQQMEQRDKMEQVQWVQQNEDDDKLSINDEIEERILAFPTKQLMYPSKYNLFPFKNKQTDNFNVFY